MRTAMTYEARIIYDAFKSKGDSKAKRRKLLCRANKAAGTLREHFREVMADQREDARWSTTAEGVMAQNAVHLEEMERLAHRLVDECDTLNTLTIQGIGTLLARIVRELAEERARDERISEVGDRVMHWMETRREDVSLFDWVMSVHAQTNSAVSAAAKLSVTLESRYQQERKDDLLQWIGDVFVDLIAVCITAGWDWQSVLFDGLETMENARESREVEI